MSTFKVTKFTLAQGLCEQDDVLAPEEPLEIQLKAQSIYVTMRTAGQDEELALGFLVSEGVIKSKADVVNLEVLNREGGQNGVNVFLHPEVKVDMTQFSRHVFAASSCGLCGSASIAQIKKKFAPITFSGALSGETVLGFPQKLLEAQTAFAQTGGLHAAGLFDSAGTLLCVREDIGRHNAVDKILGWALQQGPWPLTQHVLLVSGRPSFEIMQKALAGGIPVVAGISAPSALAVDFAKENKQTLVGFLREGRMNLYAHPERVTFAS